MLLRFALLDYLNISENIEVVEQKDLPPLLPLLDDMGCTFSISHSNNLVGLAVSRPEFKSSIGLDIEWIKPVRNFSAASFFCNDHQFSEIFKQNTFNEKTDLYYQYWTHKEAVLKSRQGSVFSEEMARIDFHKSANQSQCPDTYSSTFLDNEQKYQIAIHSHKNSAEISVKHLRFEQNQLLNDRGLLMDWKAFSLIS